MCDLMRLRHAPPALCPHLEQLAQHAATNIATPTRQSLANLNADHAPHTHTPTDSEKRAGRQTLMTKRCLR